MRYSKKRQRIEPTNWWCSGWTVHNVLQDPEQREHYTSLRERNHQLMAQITHLQTMLDEYAIEGQKLEEVGTVGNASVTWSRNYDLILENRDR